MRTVNSVLIIAIIAVLVFYTPAWAAKKASIVEDVSANPAIEIVCPDELAENSQTQLTAFIHYPDGSTEDITDLAEWSVEPQSLAEIDAEGLLTIEQINYLQQNLTVYAAYTQDEVRMDGRREIAVFAVCPEGSALEFDGQNDYIDCGDGENLDGMAEITISAWVYPTGWNKYYSGRIVSKVVYPYNAYELVLNGSGYNRAAACFYGNEAAAGVHSPQNSICLEQWYHIVATNNGAEQKIYVNGVESGSNNVVTGQIRDVPKPMWIGQITSAYVRAGFEGIIDDVRVYNRALSAEEVEQIMYSKPADDEVGLVGYWDFDEGEGQVAVDTSGNDNDGQLGSTPEADDSDPQWVGGMPVPCTIEQVIERDLAGALEIKKQVSEDLKAAIAKQHAANNMLRKLQKQKKGQNQTEWSRKQIAIARKKILFAMVKEVVSKRYVTHSIKSLSRALYILGF